MIEVKSLCGQICLGKQGENLARVVRFDEPSLWKETFGEGRCELLHQRSGDEAPYPVALNVEDGKVCWKITNADTAVAGEGQCELHYLVDDVVVKSKIWVTSVLPSLGEAASEPPEPQKAWVEQVLEAAEKVESATTHQPIIGFDKNWYVWDSESEDYIDTGVKAEGSKPIKGTDYWTVSDKAEIVREVQKTLKYAFITEVNTDELVLETVFPYSDTSNTTYWSRLISYVKSPTFYSKIPVTINGERTTNIYVNWVCTDVNGKEIEYDGTAVGTTYYFKAASSDAYIWECEVPTITATIVDAGWAEKGVRQGFISDGVLIPYVIKHNGSTNKIYDATGCNIISSGIPGTRLEAFAGMHNNLDNAVGKVVPTTIEGNAKVTVTSGADITTLYGGSHGLPYNGDTCIYINDAAIDTVYSGCYRSSMTGNAYIDISGNVTISNILGGGDNYIGTHDGDMIVTIHELAEGATITAINRNYATNLIVNLDDTSKHLIGAIRKDKNTTIYINGIKQV